MKFCFSLCFLGYLGRTLMYVQEMKLFRDAMSSWASLHSHFSLFHSLVFIHQTKLIVNIAKSVENNRILLPISIIKIFTCFKVAHQFDSIKICGCEFNLEVTYRLINYTKTLSTKFEIEFNFISFTTCKTTFTINNTNCVRLLHGLTPKLL